MSLIDSDGNKYQDLAAFHMNMPDKEEAEPRDIYFVRHGDTEDNDKGLCRGWSTVGLNADGRKDAEKAAESVKDKQLHQIVASDLPRAAQTADIISRKLGVPVEHDPGLRTWDIGAYQEQPEKDVQEHLDRLQLRAPDERPPPGKSPGESYNEFKHRFLGAVSGVLQRHPDKEVMVVSHNSPAKVLDEWTKKNGGQRTG